MSLPECSIAILCDGAIPASRGVDRRLLAAAKEIGQAVLHSDWPGFELAACRADCAVVVIPWLDLHPETGRVERFRRRAPDVPVIVVTSKSLESTRCAVELGFAAAVWFNDLERQLPAAIRIALEHSFLRRVASNADSASHLPAAVRDAVACACRSRVPIRTLDDLAAVAGVHRTALLASWQACSHGALTPKRLLDWVVLLHATARKSSRSSWVSIAEDLRVSEDTLARIGVRLLDTHLSRLNASAIDLVRAGFARGLLVPLGIRAPVKPW